MCVDCVTISQNIINHYKAPVRIFVLGLRRYDCSSSTQPHRSPGVSAVRLVDLPLFCLALGLKDPHRVSSSLTGHQLHKHHFTLSPSANCTATMSWKLTKSMILSHNHLGITDNTVELKDTHLAPLANTFSRSSSTSTITNESAKPTSPLASSTSVANDPNGIGELLQI